MKQVIQLIHPDGKKAVSMASTKYDAVKTPLLNSLKTKGELTHAEILHAIREDFKANNTEFEGSVPWHLLWVKLDLEARKEIKRLNTKSSVRFALG